MSLARNASFNLASSAAQILVLLVSVPLFVGLVGIERYGVNVLVWLVLDYVMLLAVGVDRAAINALSRTTGDTPAQSGVLATASAMGLAGGLVGAVVVLATFLPVMSSVFVVPDAVVGEIGWSVYAVALLVPFAILGNVFAAPLHAHARFLELGMIGVASSISIQLLPIVAAALFGARMDVIILAGAAARTIPFMYYTTVSLLRYASLAYFRVDRPAARDLLRFGFWSTMTNGASLLMGNMDRMLLGAVAGAARVGQYVVPANLVMRAQIFPVSLGTVLFPRLSQLADPERDRRTVQDALLSLAIVFAAILVIGSTILPVFIYRWVPEVAEPDTIWVGQVLILGIWFNGLAIVPYILLQATGRPDLVAKIHMSELVPFLLLIWVLVQQFGVVGAALAWTIRSTLDSLILFGFAGLLDLVTRKIAVLTACVFVVVLLPGALGWPIWLSIGVGVTALVTIGIWTAYRAPAPLLGAVGKIVGKVGRVGRARG